MSRRAHTAVPITNPAAAAYAQRAETLSRSAPPPQHAIAYGRSSEQRIEIFSSGGEDLPILLFLHGGAWIHGDLAWLRFMASPVTSMPAILAAATYRLAPQTRWPGQQDDVLAALETVHRQAESWGGDPGRIVIGGHSAGGQLAAIAALKGSIRVAACFPVSAPLDLRYGDVAIESDPGRVYRYLLQDRSQDEEASPIAFVRPGAPPFHIMRGENDLDRVSDSNARMIVALERAGVPVTSTVMAGAGHFDTHLSLGQSASPWYAELARAWRSETQAQTGNPS